MNYNGGGGEDTGGIPLSGVLGRLQGEAQVLNFEEAEAVRLQGSSVRWEEKKQERRVPCEEEAVEGLGNVSFEKRFGRGREKAGEL